MNLPVILTGKRPNTLVVFAFVGGIGFLVDALTLTILVNGLGWGPYEARILSFAFAVTVTWYMNRQWTFPGKKRHKTRVEYARYFAVQSIGALINLGIYAICLETSPIMETYPVLALAAGSVTALFFNFYASRHFVFPHKRIIS